MASLIVLPKMWIIISEKKNKYKSRRAGSEIGEDGGKTMNKAEKQRVLSGVMAVTMAGSTLAGMPTVMAAEAYDEVSPLKPSADTYANNLDDSTKGTLDYAVLGSTTGNIPAGINTWNDMTENINIAYLSFDISAVDVSLLDDASLKLSIKENSSDAEGAAVSVFEASDGLTEDGTAWENKPEITDRVKEQGQEDNITSEDAVARGTVAGDSIVVSGLGETIKAAKAAGKNTITFAVYLSKDVTIRIATREDAGNAPVVELTKVDAQAVADAETAINAVPDITLDNYKSSVLAEAREAAVAKYDSLTASEKAMLSDEAYTKLMTFYDAVAWKNTLDEYAVAEKLINDINEIKTEEMTAENYTAYKGTLADLRTRYDSSSFRVKALVGNKVYQLLVNAENKYASFEAADINAVKEKISLIGEVTQDNYLDRGEFIVAAREAYDKFEELTSTAYGSDTDGYNNIMSQFVTNTEGINYVEILETAEAPIEEYKKVTADAFVEAWNIIKNDAELDILNSNPEKVAEKEAVLDEFEASYYSAPINNLSASVYYSSFAEGEVTPEAAQAIEEFLCAEYQLAVDEIRAEYGDPGPDPLNPTQEFIDLFDSATVGDNLYIYLYDYRTAAEVAYGKLNADSKDRYKDQSDYCDIVYEAMMNLVDSKIRNTIQLELGEAELTKEYIDAVKKARTDRDSISSAVISYLEKYATVQYNQYKEKSDMIDSRIEDLAALAEDELGKYDGIVDELDSYGLYYMSGYYVDGDTGIKDDGDKYWNIDQYIADINEAFMAVNPSVAVDDGYTTILEYYYNQMQDTITAAESAAELANERSNADSKIASFVQHNNTIIQLRDVAAQCNEDLYQFSLMLTEDDIDDIEDIALDDEDPATQEEVLAKIQEILNAKDPAVTLDELEAAFAKLYEEIEAGATSYRALTAAYRDAYASEGFTDIQEPYMSAASLEAWGKMCTVLCPALVIPDENIYKATADDWTNRLNALYDRVMSLDKEYEYLNDFVGVEECRNEYAALKAEYEGFSWEVYYFISQDTVDTCGLIDAILNTHWTDAIKVMDMIDEAEAATLTEEWYSKLLAAESALDALEADAIQQPNAYERVAEAAKAKLAQVRKDYDIYSKLESWIGSIENIDPKLVEEYAQLYTYNEDGELEPSEFSKLIDKLVADEETLFSELELASDKVKEYINSPDNGYAAASAAIAKLNKEKNLALEAEKIDKRIIALDSLAGEEFITALEALRTDIDALVATISYEGEDKRGNDAAIEFNMITQYAQYENYVNNYDKSVADKFGEAVNAIGDITYTTDLEVARTALDSAAALQGTLNDAQLKYAYSAVIKLGILEKKYEKISAAKDAAQDVLSDITEMVDIIENTVLTADPYDYEYVKLIEGYSEVISQSDVVNTSIDSIKDTDAYNYLVQNGYIENYENTLAEFKDDYAYIGVMQAIEVLYEDSKNVIQIDEEGNVTIDEEERNILVEETKNAMSLYAALDEDLKENVLNYSSLQWLVKNIDAARVNDIIATIKALPPAEEITYAKYIGSVESIKAAYDSLLSENQARVRKDDNGATYEKFMEILIKMGILEEEYGDLGGKAGDVNGDDIVDINDVILMVDYAFGIKTVETAEDERQFLRGNLVKETGVSEEKIDFHDIAAVIDFLEFDN